MFFYFDDYESGVKIFREWKCNEQRIKNDLEITFVEAPFPKNTIKTSDGETYRTDNNKGYFIHISTNPQNEFDKIKTTTSNDQTFGVFCHRYHFMPELHGADKRNSFKELYLKFGKCYIAPCSKDVSNSNSIVYNNKNKIEFANVKFTSGVDLDRTDNAIVVLGDSYLEDFSLEEI
jgi:hypothetical protein